jgi:2-hydroxy-6-oxonona-2,4-dienedioate hydrolase
MPNWLRRVLLAGSLTGGIVLYRQQRREKQQVLEHLKASSQLIRTKAGWQEYAMRGKGQPVLMMHGAGGGYDQGLLLEHLLDMSRYQVIAPSRPGYRRTPLTTGRSMAAQADACAALLDELAIPSVIVAAISAGGLPALQFALRHPARCRALLLISAVAPAIQQFHAPQWIADVLYAAMSADFIMWLSMYKGRRWFFALQGLDYPHFTPAQKAIADGIVDGFFPVTDWRDGTLNDIAQLESGLSYSLKDIHVPTQLVHGTHDTFAPYEVAQATANAIANARLMTIEDGTHFIILTHKDKIATTLDQLVETATSIV